MLAFIYSNFSTIVVSLVLILLVSWIVFKMIKDKKNHKSSCGCGCSGCPSAGICHNDFDKQAKL